MKITLIDPTQSITNYGLRALANSLVRLNHDVQLVFMNQPVIDYDYEYPQRIYHDLRRIVADSDCIGLSFVSNFYGQAEKLTRYLHNQCDIPVIWGGIHAMAAPEKSLETADFVCIGEGEACLESFCDELKTGRNWRNVPNLWFRENGGIVRDDPAPLNPDIDSCSMPLYDNNREYIRRGDSLLPMQDDYRKDIMGSDSAYYDLKESIAYPYLTMASRGCPNSCAYCCNNLFKSVYRGKGKLLRRRSNAQIIAELEMILGKMPYVNIVEFFDDDFLYPDRSTISEFAGLYKTRIGLPFRCNFRPESVTHEKLAYLKEAGLISIEMGLQSARTNNLYKRHFNRETFRKACDEINNLGGMVPHYDIIVDNPLEKIGDVRETLRFIAELPRPYHIAAYSLTFFPGTQLHELAKSKGLISNEIRDIINKKNFVQYEFRQPFVKFLIFYIRNISFEKPVFKGIFNGLTSRLFMPVFNSIFFYPLWIGILFGKRLSTKIRHPEIPLFPK